MNLSGISFRQGELKKLMNSQTETCYFKANIEDEPTNKFDPNAKKVVCNGYHIGYIPKELTSSIKETECNIEVYWWTSKYMYIAKMI